MYNCKVRILKYANGVFSDYQPEIGKVYDAKYVHQTSDNMRKCSPICIIDVKDKHIALRKDEYEIVEMYGKEETA